MQPLKVYECDSCAAEILDGENCYYNYIRQEHYCYTCISCCVAEGMQQ